MFRRDSFFSSKEFTFAYLKSEPFKLFYHEKSNNVLQNYMEWQFYNLKIHFLVKSKSDGKKFYIYKQIPGCSD
jgi:hypothetical protein